MQRQAVLTQRIAQFAYSLRVAITEVLRSAENLHRRKSRLRNFRQQSRAQRLIHKSVCGKNALHSALDEGTLWSMENAIPSIARSDSSAEMRACRERRQPDASPTRMSAINPPRNSAARIHSATGRRLRISPRGGSFGCANSSESPSLSSSERRSPRSEPGVAAGSCGSSLNLWGTVTMLAPKKSGRQGNARPFERPQGNSSRCSLQKCGTKNSEWTNRALARQDFHQRERHDCAREDCQRHPSPQLRMRFRHAEQVNRGIRPVKNFRAGHALRRRKSFRSRPTLGGRFARAFGNLAGHCPDTSTNRGKQKQNF